jgi:hypothetical protein
MYLLCHECADSHGSRESSLPEGFSSGPGLAAPRVRLRSRKICGTCNSAEYTVLEFLRHSHSGDVPRRQGIYDSGEASIWRCPLPPCAVLVSPIRFITRGREVYGVAVVVWVSEMVAAYVVGPVAPAVLGETGRVGGVRRVPRIRRRL